MYKSCLTSTRSRLCASVLKCLSTAALSLLFIAGPFGNSNALRASELLSSVAASKPANTAALGAHFLSWAPGNRVESLSITLPLRNQAQLKQFLTRLSTPSDPEYHQYITGAQFDATYGPTQSDYNAVVAWAQSVGLKVTKQYSSRVIVDVSAPVSVINSAFGVRLGDYKLPSGQTIYTHDRAPQVPVSIASKISGVIGLTNVSLLRHDYIKFFPNVKNSKKAGPALIGSAADGGLTPTDIKTAYTLTTSLKGQGQSVALYELQTYDTADVTAYTTKYNLGTPNLTNVPVDGDNQAPAGIGQVEVTLDIDMILALAPQAHVYVYEGENGTNAITDTYQQIADDFSTTNATSVSSSWGLDEASAADSIGAEATAFDKMQAQGQTQFAAAGDTGAYDNGTSLSVDDPASQPNVTGVGGTTLTVAGPGGAYTSETTWDTSGLNSANGPEGGGGGVSIVWPKQSYESGVVPQFNARTVPDVSLNADPNTGYDIDVLSQGGFFVVGGTSAAAPLWAGFLALVNQSRAADGQGPIGFLNPTIYTIGGGVGYNIDFHDIADGSNNLFYLATTGYDLATGWGTFKAEALLNDLTDNGLANLPTGTLTGVVTDPNSKPVAGAVITAFQQGTGAFAGTATTDSTGTYTVVLPATIELNVSADGPPNGAIKYAGVTVNGIELKTGATTTQNFQLAAALTWQPNSIQLISVPYDYTGIADLATLFGVSDPLTSNDPILYFWDPTLLEYIGSPSSPADTFHIGKGYWALFPNNPTVWYLHQQGTPAATQNPFEILLQTGWNMIGDPYTQNVPLSVLTVDTVPSTGPVPLSSSPLIAGPLYAYTGGSTVYTALDPTTDSIDTGLGYWIRATGPCVLIYPSISALPAPVVK